MYSIITQLFSKIALFFHALFYNITLRSSGPSNLHLQQQYYDEANRLLKRAIDLEESGNKAGEVQERYQQGIRVLQKGLNLKFLPSER